MQQSGMAVLETDRFPMVDAQPVPLAGKPLPASMHRRGTQPHAPNRLQFPWNRRMSAAVNANSSHPALWYREPLVWMVFAIPATAVLGGIVMLVLANVTWDGLVASDYYRQGMQINRSLAREAEAARLGLRATVTFPATDAVEVRLSGDGAGAGTDGGDWPTLRFAHATRSGADVRVRLARGAGGVWRGVLPPLPSGKWYAELGNEHWRLVAPAWMPPAAGGLVLRAPASGKPPGS